MPFRERDLVDCSQNSPVRKSSAKKF